MKKSNQEKYKETFDEVHVPEALMGKVIDMGKRKKENKKWKSGKMVAVAACALCVVSVTTISAANLWGSYVHDRYGIQDSKVEDWKEEKLLQENKLSVKKNGVKVECKEVIASGPYAHVLLEVSLDDTVEMAEDPGFKSIGCVVSDGELETLGAGVSTSLCEPELMIDRENKVFYLEYQLKLKQEVGEEEKTSWDGHDLTIRLLDYGNCSTETARDIDPIIMGKWELRIPMESYDKTITLQKAKDFGNGFVLKKLTLSPISIDTEFESKEAIDEETEAPMITGYETKDGEKIEVNTGTGVTTREGKRIKDNFILEKVVDISNVTALYFDDVKVEMK